MRRARRSAPAGPVLLAALVLLTACGGAQEPEELVAVPYPEEAVDEAVDALEEHVVPESAADALREASPDPQDEGPELELETTGPPIAATREFVAERDEQARVSDHLLADLTGDGASEVLVATVDEDHEAMVEVARWEGDAFTTTARLPVGAADDLGRLRLADLGERAPRVLVLALQHEGATRVAVWDADGEGGLQPPDECPLDSSVRVRSPLGLQLRLTCDAEEASQRVLQWAHGAFWPSTVDREEIAELSAGDGLSGVLADEEPTGTR
jgi:hypothetical protein